MKQIIKEILYGFVVVVLVTICEFIITLPLGNPWDTYEPNEITNEIYRTLINKELILTSIPTAIVVYLILRFLKTNNIKDARRRGFIWTLILFSNYALIGIGNDNFNIIFSTLGIYTLLICSALASLTYIIILKKKNI